MDDAAEQAFRDFIGQWPSSGMINKTIWATDMTQEYRRAFEAGFKAGKRSTALDELGKLDGELLEKGGE